MRESNNKDKVFLDLLNLCKELGRMPYEQELYDNKIVGCVKTLKRYCKEVGYKDYKDFCRKNGYRSEYDIIVNDIIIPQSDLSLDILINIYKNFNNVFGRFPESKDFTNRNNSDFSCILPNRKNRDFMRYMSYLQGRGLSSSGMGFKKAAVSAFNIYIENIIAEDDKESYGLFRNFTRGLQPIPKNQVYSKEPITYEEYKMFIDTLLEDKNYLGVAWVATAFNTGARRAEIIQFKTEILNHPIHEGQNYIMSNLVMGKGRAGGKPLEYMVNTEALKYIKLWIDKREYDHEYIFTSNYNGIDVMSESWANTFCTDILSDIIGRRINPHIWKSSAITHLLNQDIPMNLVSKYVAQHNDVSTTQNFYDLRDFEEEKGQIFKYLD